MIPKNFFIYLVLQTRGGNFFTLPSEISLYFTNVSIYILVNFVVIEVNLFISKLTVSGAFSILSLLNFGNLSVLLEFFN